MGLEAYVQAVVQLVQLLHVGIPFAMQELVFIVVIEYMHAAADEAWEIGGPDELVFALLLEVDNHGDVV